MTRKELYRHHIILQVKERRLTQVKAAEILKITDRQVRNLLKSFEIEGEAGLVSKKRGKRSNRALDPELELQILALIREKYDDFGPTLIHEKLREKHEIRVSVETVRKLMIKNSLHASRKRKGAVHRERMRRENFGELIQIDGSIHDWFEGRGEKCALIVFIDDATSKITALHFHESESLDAYFVALGSHLKRYGRPLGIYSDRHAIFGGAKRIKNAQLTRAFEELEIEGILANSPQAKGRVERANRTLQDRLVKEMRLRGISNIEEGNAFLKEYVETHNEKFSKEPRGQIDTHRPLDDAYDLQYILTRRESRIVSNSLSISFGNKKINILEAKISNRLKGQKVNVIERENGEVELYYKGEKLKTSLFEEMPPKVVFDLKDKMLWKPKPKKPGSHHPWRRYGRQKQYA